MTAEAVYWITAGCIMLAWVGGCMMGWWMRGYLASECHPAIHDLRRSIAGLRGDLDRIIQNVDALILIEREKQRQVGESPRSSTG